ncbi:MAG: hypothetical protein IPP74_06980 [Alphaproteobacteria bacterium]|nr:hypothetical protein [Alphaproteobacteria bacterium]
MTILKSLFKPHDDHEKIMERLAEFEHTLTHLRLKLLGYLEHQQRHTALDKEAHEEEQIARIVYEEFIHRLKDAQEHIESLTKEIEQQAEHLALAAESMSYLTPQNELPSASHSHEQPHFVEQLIASGYLSHHLLHPTHAATEQTLAGSHESHSAQSHSPELHKPESHTFEANSTEHTAKMPEHHHEHQHETTHHHDHHAVEHLLHSHENQNGIAAHHEHHKAHHFVDDLLAHGYQHHEHGEHEHVNPLINSPAKAARESAFSKTNMVTH